jgi:hypothetical protein
MNFIRGENLAESSPSSDEQPKKPRKQRSPNKDKKPDNAGLTSALINVHALLAGMTSIPEIAIEREQAEILATAATEVMALYDFGMSQEQQAWVNLMMVAGSIYGTKVFAYKMRLADEKAKAEEETQ